MIELRDFYPTPKNLIAKMLDKVDLSTVRDILEPSAGKGDILDYIQDKFRYHRNKFIFDAIEIVPELRSILKGKGYNVVFDDFLSFNTFKNYDLLVMNPPFSDGDKHLLKALELQSQGGQVVCLLNAETIKNPYSVYRKDLIRKLNELNADITYLKGEFTSDDVFRKTDVEIALIYVNVPQKERTSRILQGLKEELYQNDTEFQEKQELISSNFIEGLIEQYNFEMQAGIRLINEFESVKGSFLRSFDKDNPYNNSSVLSLTINNSNNSSRYDNRNLVNRFVDLIRNKYWRALFESKEIARLSTSDLREQYFSKLEEMSAYEFNLQNIQLIQAELKAHLYSSIEDTILKLFDELSFQNSFEDFSNNIHYYNGWKTNKSWKINHRVITLINGFDSWFNKEPYYNYKVKDKLSDIEKVFNYLDDGTTEEKDLDAVLQEAQENRVSKNIECKYFTVSFFKKGTCHITFKDLDLLKKFNLYGSMKKGWLPPSFGKKEYSMMNGEEKKVIDNFCGKSEYNEILKRKNYYIHSVREVKLLE